jgi:hypothetical protein
MIPPIHYRVNDKIIFNDLLAKYEAFTSGKPVEFYCYDDEYSALDWTKEPLESMKELMDRHAHALRAKYGRIVLCWSGGTDSHSIYHAFMRNNLHIDEIVYWRGGDAEPWYSDLPIKWLQDNHTDPATKITVRNRFDPEAKKQLLTNEDWIFQNRTMIPKFALTMYDSLFDDCEQTHGHTSWCLINGHEQPRVFLKDGKYWATHSSINYLSVMGANNVECFFNEPLITLKQSHILKRTYQHLAKVGQYDQRSSNLYQQYDEAFINQRPIIIKNKNNTTYTAWQNSLGRSTEAIPGQSYFQKTHENMFEHTPVNIEKIDGSLSRSWDLGFDALLKQDNDIGKMFERGIKNLLLERNFCRHLDEQRNDRNISLIAKKTGYIVHSKKYCLGE